MTDNQPTATKEQILQELLSAVKDNVPVARGFGRPHAAPSFYGDWLVMDRDCAQRVKRAAAALRQLATRDRAILEANASAAAPKEHEGRAGRELLVEELLTAIEANQPLASGDGPSRDVPTFDHHDSEAESRRPGWELVIRDHAQRIEKAAAALEQDLAG